MSIQTELTRLTNAKAAIQTAIEGKGVTVPSGTLLDGMAALIESIEAGGGGGTDISPWKDMVTFSITPSEDLTGGIDFTSFIPGRTSSPDIFMLGQRAETPDTSYVQSMVRFNTWNSWQRLYYSPTSSNSKYPAIGMSDGKFMVEIGTYKLAAGVLYWGAMLWYK